jgi:predicted GIY-YIG superfamily endonuclease
MLLVDSRSIEKGGGRCARYLRDRAPLHLVFKRRLGSRSLALKAERRIKRLSKHQKAQIARSRPSNGQLIARLGIHSENGSLENARSADNMKKVLESRRREPFGASDTAVD